MQQCRAGIDGAAPTSLCPAMDPKTSHLTIEAQAAAEARRLREAQALRENLAKRKAQTRVRAETRQPDDEAKPCR